MRGSRNFRQGGGGGPGQSDKKALTTVFLVLSLFYWSQMVYFEENYHFSRFQRGSNIFQGGSIFFQGGGGVQLLIPYRNPYNLWFSRGGLDPLSPSGSALVGFHLPFVSFQYLSSDDVYNTTTQGDSIANGVKTEPEEGAGAHSSAGCFWTTTGQTWTQGVDSLGEAVAT